MTPTSIKTNGYFLIIYYQDAAATTAGEATCELLGELLPDLGEDGIFIQEMDGHGRV